MDTGPFTTAPSLVQVGDSAVIAIGAPPGFGWFVYQQASTGTWSPPPRGYAPNPVQVPSVAQVGDKAMIATVEGDGSVVSWARAWAGDNLQQGAWTYLPVDGPQAGINNTNTFAYASLAQVGDSSVIVAVDQSGSLWFYWQAIGTTPWNPEPVDGPAAGNSDRTLAYPSVAQVGNSSVITASDDDGNLWFFWQTIGTGGWNAELAASAESPGG